MYKVMNIREIEDYLNALGDFLATGDGLETLKDKYAEFSDGVDQLVDTAEQYNCIVDICNGTG